MNPGTIAEENNRVRKIIHVDMDAFYASVEIKDNPSLEGQPVVVGGSPQSRAVVSAASYEARKYGIRSAMACSRAEKLCPHAVFVPPRFERYREISDQIHDVFRSYTDMIEPVSLDEAWLDVTVNHQNCPSATWVAQRIKTEIRNSTGLTASAGVSYNKFLAKIASDEKKPDGLFVITPENARDFLKNIPVGKIPGVGKVTGKRLLLLGIEKGYQLLEKEEEYLVRHFGKFGSYLYQIIRGIDEREVISHRERKSVGIETTFGEDLEYGEAINRNFEKLLRGLFKRLEKSDRRGKTLSIKVKFHDFQQITRSMTVADLPLSNEIISRMASQKLYDVANNEYPAKKIRLLGVSISNFESEDHASAQNEQLDIFHFLENPEI